MKSASLIGLALAAAGLISLTCGLTTTRGTKHSASPLKKPAEEADLDPVDHVTLGIEVFDGLLHPLRYRRSGHDEAKASRCE